MWWFILCVSLTGHRLPPWNIASERVCEGVSRWDSCFNQETESSGLPSPVWRGLSWCFEGLDGVRGRGGFASPFLPHCWDGASQCTSHLLPSDEDSCHRLPGFSGLGVWTEGHHRLSWASSLQTADRGTSQPPLPSESIPILKKKKKITHSLSVYKYNLLVLFLSGES